VKAKHWAAVALGLAYMGAAFVAAEYVAAGLYFATLKTWPSHIDAHTWLGLWDQLGTEPVQRKRLLGSAAIALALAYVVVPILIARAGRRPRPLHGEARWANAGEIRKAGLCGEHGIIVGKENGRFLMFPGEQFAAAIAPTRSGKTVGVVIPNALNWPDSLVVLDIKGEIFAATSGFRAAHGQAVFRFAPFSTTFATHRWNPLSSISRDPYFRIGDIMTVAQTFWPSGTSNASGKESSDNAAFFNEQAQILFKGMVLYLMETPERPCTMGELVRQMSGDGEPLGDYLRRLIAERAASARPLSKDCVDAFHVFLSNAENTFASIKASFDAPMAVFSNPIVDAATSADDFDLRDLRRRRMTVYVAIEPNKLAAASRLINLFFAQLVNLNTDVLPEQDSTLQHQCLVILDEFAALGRVQVIASAVSFLAGYGLRLLPILQSTEQLEALYGQVTARNMLKNCDVRIVFPPDDMREAEEVSRTLGYLTQDATSVGQSRSAGAGRGASVSHSENVSQQRRALLLPQEVREMAPDSEILLKSGCKPIRCQRIRYFEEDVFMKRILPPLAVPPMDMARARAIAERRLRVVEEDDLAGLDLSMLEVNGAALPTFSGDPTKLESEAKAVVASFLAQVHWSEEAGGAMPEARTNELIAAEL